MHDEYLENKKSIYAFIREGYNAYCDGLSRTNNPYDKESLDYEYWETGWYEGASDD